MAPLAYRPELHDEIKVGFRQISGIGLVSIGAMYIKADQNTSSGLDICI